jgi:hypothetical protein
VSIEFVALIFFARFADRGAAGAASFDEYVSSRSKHPSASRAKNPCEKYSINI